MTNEKYLCPACGKPLFTCYEKIYPNEPYYRVFCPWGICSDGLCEHGGRGRTEPKAYADLLDNYGKEKKG